MSPMPKKRPGFANQHPVISFTAEAQWEKKNLCVCAVDCKDSEPNTPMKTHFPQFLSTLGGAISLSIFARADVRLPFVLGSHMVLQRDKPVPIWGTASPGEHILVLFREQQKTATADDAGKWMVKLDPLEVGAPDVLTVKGNNTLRLEDVLVGEVWLGAGQSNMALGTGSFMKNDAGLTQIVTGGAHPQLRILGRGGWAAENEDIAKKTSAMMLAFAVPLQQKLGVPVGILVGAVSGTPSGYWLSEDALHADAGIKESINRFAQTYNYDEAMKRYPDLLAAWQKRSDYAKTVGRSAGRPPAKPQQPGEASGKIGHLYEAHIRPLIPFAIRGVLWDQGESGTAIQGVDQLSLMGALIRSWRRDFGQDDFPFLYVQKPSGGGPALDPNDAMTNQADALKALPARVPDDSDWREMHIRIMGLANTAMVSTSDLGGKTHPTNKSGYGARAARVALGFVYGQPLEFYGPLYAGHSIKGGKIRVRFSHIGQGLTFRGEAIQGFAVAGEDRRFEWATAAIEGDTVVVSSDQVTQPKLVRYAFGAVHPWANLFNREGLPALPFRTDGDAAPVLPSVFVAEK